MAMETRLSLRQSQRVVMTPLLQQAIQLLQLSTLELQEVVQKELLENPLLEEMQPETAEQPDGKDAPPDVPTAPPAEPLSSDAAPTPTTERQTDDLPFDLTAVIFDDHEERSLVAQEDREDLPFENMVRSVSSLTDHLDEQLRYASDDPLVRRIGTEIIGNLDEDGIPRLRVNSLYRSLLRNSADGEARQYVDQKLRSALWLIKSVDQRQRTLRKVTQSIVKFQREFLDKGLPYLRPLSLRDVGEDIGMHESTISRVTTNKYVETPQGLFELKFFFHSGIASGDGEMVSSVSVKKMIQDLLGNEDATKPLSDQEVAGILKGRGLTIARRTVAKYREELGILPSHQRRLQPRKR